MIEILLQGILACVLIPDFDEFSMCIDNLIVEVNEMVLDEWYIWDEVLSLNNKRELGEDKKRVMFMVN